MSVNNFVPFVRITRTDDERIAVMFDSACDEDATRTPRIVFIKCDIEGLSWQVDEEGDEGAKVLRVYLTIGGGEGATQYLLGTISGGFAAASVRPALSDAFHTAFAAYLQSNQRFSALGSVPSPTATQNEASHAYVRPPQHLTEPTGRRAFLKSVGAIAAVGMLGFFGVYVFSAFSGRSVDPIQAAVAQNMAQDPASILAQVELTRETLRQMGLDPGRAGDLGCLAPQ